MQALARVKLCKRAAQVSNFGSSFAIKPWNFWNELPSRVAYEDDGYQQCSAYTAGNNATWPPPNTAL